MSGRVDFSKNAGVYDDRHGAFIADDLAQRLIAEAGLPAASTTLDIGAGTGRVAIPFAARGCRVVALDPAAPMLQQLREKAPTGSLRLAIGGAAALPFPDAAFDAVVIARLLYLLPEWRLAVDEAVRVLRSGGRLLHEWANGEPDEEWVQIREHARALFEAAGVANPFHRGARHEDDVDRALADRGMTRCGDVRARSTSRTTMARFLDRVESGECSYIWNVPPDVQRTCLPRLRAWAAERFDLGREVVVPRELKWTLHRRT